MASASGGATVDLQTGSLKSLSDLTTSVLPEYRKRLDDFVQAVVTEVNAIHRTGYTLNKRTDLDFFDPRGDRPDDRSRDRRRRIRRRDRRRRQRRRGRQRGRPEARRPRP